MWPLANLVASLWIHYEDICIHCFGLRQKSFIIYRQIVEQPCGNILREQYTEQDRTEDAGFRRVNCTKHVVQWIFATPPAPKLSLQEKKTWISTRLSTPYSNLNMYFLVLLRYSRWYDRWCYVVITKKQTLESYQFLFATVCPRAF